jgi:hypothetical protein
LTMVAPGLIIETSYDFEPMPVQSGPIFQHM